MSLRLLPPGAACGAHPDRAAVDLCSRCGAFVCLECVTSVAATVLCRPCAGRVREAPDELPAPVVRALVLTAGGLLFPPLGFAGVLLSAWQLRRSARSRLAPRAEEYLRVALNAGLIGTLISAGLWLTWGARLLLRALGRG